MTPKHRYANQRTHSVSQEPLDTISFKILVPSFQLAPPTMKILMLPFKSIVVICNPVFVILSYIYPCHKAQMASTFSFHPMWFVARALTTTCNCHSAACLLFSTVLLNVVFGHPGLLLPSGNPFLTNDLAIMVALLCTILVIVDHWSWSSQRNAPTEK